MLPDLIFQPYHQKIRHPIDYYRFGLDFIGPLIEEETSRIYGEEHLEEIQKALHAGENAILLGNHQTEPDPQVISILHDNLVINPKMWVFVGMGFYDTDVPYFATETAINQLLLPDPLQKNITLHHYAGGHMFYVDPAVKQPFFNDIKTFFSK